MRILFVPCQSGAISHGIPLVALWNKLPSERYETAFLVPEPQQDFFRLLGCPILNISHEGLRTEMVAYHRFKPDIVVDDLSISTALASRITDIPRISIQRTGSFPNSQSKNAKYTHSSGLKIDDLPDMSYLGFPAPRELADFLVGNSVVVPGIRKLELLTEPVQKNSKYFFSGPLILDDHLISTGTHFVNQFDGVYNFLIKNSGRKLVYISIGTEIQASAEMWGFVSDLLERGFSVVTNFFVPDVARKYSEQYYHGSYLPMHMICSKASLFIHHCGSGTYHYALIHLVPNISIGSRCFDRDDVAAHLRDIGATAYVRAPEECPQFRFKLLELALEFLNKSAANLPDMRRALYALKLECESTSASFKFEEVIDSAISRVP